MVVCPTCREVNEEGRAVQKVARRWSRARSRSCRVESSERPPIEIRKPPQPEVAATGHARRDRRRRRWCGLRPSSPRSLRGNQLRVGELRLLHVVPEGWEAGPAQFGADVTLDQFAPPTGSATVVVEAVDLERGRAQPMVRVRPAARRGAGLTPGPGERGEARRRRRAPMGRLGRRRGRGQLPDARGRHRERERRLAGHAERPAGRVRHERRRVPRHARLVGSPEPRRPRGPQPRT